MADADGLIKLEARLRRDAHLLILALVVAVFVLLVDFQIKRSIAQKASEIARMLGQVRQDEGAPVAGPVAGSPRGEPGWDGGRRMDAAARVAETASGNGVAAEGGDGGGDAGSWFGPPGNVGRVEGGEPGGGGVEVPGD